MRKIQVFIFALFIVATSIAQSVPKGMKYQAVARDLAGNMLSKQQVVLKVTLFGNQNGQRKDYYIETHEAVTTDLGLFNLTIGEGKSPSAKFENVPWSAQEVWMEVSIQDRNKNFTTISNSRLLAVPYAFHAATASQLVGTNLNSLGMTSVMAANSPGTPSQTWSLAGNSVVSPTDKLGTTTASDLVLITSNIERMRIFANGDIKVKGNVELNTTGGSTINKGPLTVAQKSPTALTGTLTVDGASSLKNTLTVDGASSLRSTLTVNGASSLKNTLTVDGASALKSTLSVDGATTLNNTLQVKNTSAFGGNVAINATTASSSTLDGALVVAGGVGIVKDLNVGGNTTVAGTADVTGKTTLNNVLDVKGVSSFAENADFAKDVIVQGEILSTSLAIKNTNSSFLATLENTNEDEGDGLEIKLGKTHSAYNGSSLTDGGYLNVTNPGTEIFQNAINTIRGWVIDKKPVQPTDVLNFYPSALIAGTVCKITNMVVEKLNTALDLPLETPNIHILDETMIFPGIDLGFLGEIPALNIPALDVPSGVELIPRLPQLDCQGLPSLTLPNISFTNVNNSLTNENQFISFKDKDGRELGSVRAQSVNDWSRDYLSGSYFVHLMAGIAGIDVVGAIAGVVDGFTDIADSYNSIGVEYASGHADYAEWMERADLNETISAGHIVGVKGGKVSKDLNGAEQIMVVSTNPIMVGNTPEASQTNRGQKIAFMGQVPVNVVGPVSVGDFIVANGDGYGKAVHPTDMTAQQLKLTIGRALSAATSNGTNRVNALIGVDKADYAMVLETMDKRMKTVEAKLDAIITGFKNYGKKVTELNERNKKVREAKKLELQKRMQQR